MMGNTTNTPLVNGRAGLHEQQAALSQQFNASGPSYQAQMNTPGQAFSPLKTRRMRTTSATPLSNSNNQNNELQQGMFYSNCSCVIKNLISGSPGISRGSLTIFM
jgi:hypothetical protein